MRCRMSGAPIGREVGAAMERVTELMPKVRPVVPPRDRLDVEKLALGGGDPSAPFQPPSLAGSQPYGRGSVSCQLALVGAASSLAPANPR